MMSAAALAAIHAKCFACGHAWSEQSFSELLSQPGTRLYNTNQGFLLTRSAADETEILTIAVLPEARRRGMAKGLMRQALGEISGHCFLEVDVRNKPAIRMYKQMGFVTVATRKAYYATSDSRSDALVMSLSIINE